MSDVQKCGIEIGCCLEAHKQALAYALIRMEKTDTEGYRMLDLILNNKDFQGKIK